MVTAHGWLGLIRSVRLPKRYAGAGEGGDQMGFEEGNTYQYSFMIPFDYPALFAAMGGDKVVEPRLDHFFTALRCWGKPCFNIENEPDFVTPYAYVFLGKPWKTQEVVTRIGQETFKAAPDGIPGNDDLGATSGVYVWNALGFYPAIPGVGGVVLGTPMFDKATLQLAGGRTVLISREGEGIYVQQVMLEWDFLSQCMAADQQDSCRDEPVAFQDECGAKHAAGNCAGRSAAGVSIDQRLVLRIFVDETIDERDEFFAGAGKDKYAGGCVPVELETRGECGDPDLANRGIGRDYEFHGGLFENNVEHTTLLLDFKAGLVFFFAGDEVLF